MIYSITPIQSKNAPYIFSRALFYKPKTDTPLHLFITLVYKLPKFYWLLSFEPGMAITSKTKHCYSLLLIIIPHLVLSEVETVAGIL